jgi:hypothetical protein
VVGLGEKKQLKQPLDKLAELARAHWAEHEEGRPVVESALSPNEREPCIQSRVICQNIMLPAEVSLGGRTKQFATSKEHNGKLYASFTRRLFAQRDLCGHLSIFPAFLGFAIGMRRIDWGAWHVVGR